jgi:hypothetical protein
MHPEIRDHELDGCVGKNICVDYLEPGVRRSRRYFGVLQEYSKPWYLDLMFEYRTDTSITAAHAVAKKSRFSFAGEDGAIIQVVCENRVVYENTGLPDRYPVLDTRDAVDLDVLNELRRGFWGDLFLYG